MSVARHGISVGIERMDDQFIVSIKAIGRLTHQDYEMMLPLLEGAFEQLDERHVRILFDATALEGWEMRAAWDDLKLGIQHGADFEKIALLGKSGWPKIAAKIGDWFVSGHVKFFDNFHDAINWLIVE